MIVNWLAVGITVICTGITVYLLDNLTLAIVMLPVLMGIRCCIGELLLARELKISVKQDIIAEFMMAGGFIIVSWLINSWLSSVLYLAMYAIYLWWKQDTVYDITGEIRKRIKK